ncbi:uncharacterized protein LOC130891086 [Diorhabda carinulata]|uniref:uncharacterized protein LOC130891086 n=1 Tax=Diorhabda carinulata TaxID=1163345 RepID=UPI0025A29452|nr:uncharacterized protein LOC130891086 [Diorhabda carinulata]
MLCHVLILIQKHLNLLVTYSIFTGCYSLIRWGRNEFYRLKNIYVDVLSAYRIRDDPRSEKSKIFPSYSTTWSQYAFSLNKDDLRKIVGMLTGHCSVNYHLMEIGESPDTFCCFRKKPKETAEHLLCECEAIHKQRLHSSFLMPEEVSRIASTCYLTGKQSRYIRDQYVIVLTR